MIWPPKSQSGVLNPRLTTTIKKHPAAVASPARGVKKVLALLPIDLPEQVIEGDQDPAIRPVESDASIE